MLPILFYNEHNGNKQIVVAKNGLPSNEGNPTLHEMKY